MQTHNYNLTRRHSASGCERKVGSQMGLLLDPRVLKCNIKSKSKCRYNPVNGATVFLAAHHHKLPGRVSKRSDRKITALRSRQTQQHCRSVRNASATPTFGHRVTGGILWGLDPRPLCGCRSVGTCLHLCASPGLQLLLPLGRLADKVLLLLQKELLQGGAWRRDLQQCDWRGRSRKFRCF